MENPLKIVLRDALPKDQKPVSDVTYYPWQDQIETGNPALVKIASKCTAQFYKMATPNGAPVIVGKPTYDDTTVPSGYHYDCHNFPFQCYEKFKYFVQAGSLWDVYNDDALATKIVHNEPAITRNRTGQLADENEKPSPSILNTPFPTAQKLTIQSGDVILFWVTLYMGDHKYIRGWHSCVVEKPVFETRNSKQYLTLDTTVRTKDGSNDPRSDSLLAVVRTYGTGFLRGDEPVGVYRLKQ